MPKIRLTEERRPQISLKIEIDNVYQFCRLSMQETEVNMTFLSRSADDRPRLHRAARRQRTLHDLALTLTFFVSVAFAAALVFGVIGH